MITELKEVTDWGKDSLIPNNTYYVNDAGKCIAYRRVSDGVLEYFTKPLMFTKTHRKFESKKLEEMPN